MRVSILCFVIASIGACRSETARQTNSTSDASGGATVSSTTVGADTLPQITAETLEVVPKDSATREQVSRIETYRARLDSLLGTRAPVVRFYARLGKEDDSGCVTPTDSVVAVPDPDNWPENRGAVIVLVVEQGRVLAVREFPTSCSGDWENSYTHTFDTLGHTVAFRRFSGFFNGCPRVAHELSTYYFAPSAGTVLAKHYSMTDRDGKPFSPALCEAFYYRYPYQIFSRWGAAATGMHFPLVP